MAGANANMYLLYKAKMHVACFFVAVVVSAFPGFCGYYRNLPARYFIVNNDILFTFLYVRNIFNPSQQEKTLAFRIPKYIFYTNRVEKYQVTKSEPKRD